MPLPPLPPLRHVFDTGLRSFAPRSGNLDMLVQQQLELVARNFDMRNTPPQNSDSEDLIAEMGDYFTRTAMLWAHLTEHLAQGPHIDQESHRAHERSKAETHLSDLREIVRIDVHTARLRRIRDLSLKFSQEVQAAWRPESTTMNKHSVMQTSISPFCEGKKSTTSEATSFASDSDPLHFASRKLLPNKGQMSHHPDVNGDMSGSESSSDDNDEQFQAIDMDALRQRGKGVYFCPKGLKCDKGGVDKDGNLVVFDRNSSFAQHCNKHRKPWRCDVPGCPNPPKKRRFARRDGLERHKTTVKHYMVT